MISHRTLQMTLALLFLLALQLPCISMAAEGFNLTTVPEKILIGAQYSGMKLQIKGTAPAGSGVILRFTGAPATMHLREKGKVFNLLWMNIGTVTLANAPQVCIIDSSRPLTEMGRTAAAYSLDGLVAAIEVEEGADTESIDVHKEFLALKKGEGLYSQTEQGVLMGPQEGDLVPFTASLAIPSALRPGEYHVEAVAIRDNKVVGDTTTTISAEMVGFPAWLNQMAFQRSLLYGVLATVIALFSGLVIGLVFQSKGAH